MPSAPAGHRICFLLRIRPERAQEYRERHAAVWPEMPLEEIFHLE